jgi:hypothetical protein
MSSSPDQIVQQMQAGISIVLKFFCKIAVPDRF